MSKRSVVALCLLCFSVGIAVFMMPKTAEAAITCDFYAAPNGTASGIGSSVNPWSLQTALNQGSALFGKTLCLKGGTYFGKFSSNLVGATVRSAPGEWAKIDGLWTTTLSSAIDSTQTFITVSSTTGYNQSGGNIIFIDNEQLYVHDDSNFAGNTFRVVRGWNSTAASHSATTLVRQTGNNLTVNGSDTIYRDFEIMNSSPTRSFPGDAQSQSSPDGRGEGIMAFGPRTKFINLVIHDVQEGIFMAESAVNAEVSGSIIFNNGFINDTRGHGHGLYMQNADPNQPKKIFDVISFNNFATGMKAFGQQAGHANGFDFQGVISFNNASVGNFPGNPVKSGEYPNGYTNAHRFVGLEVGPGNPANPSTNILVKNNYFYHMPGTRSEFGLGRFGYGGIRNNDITIEDNYFAGGEVGVALEYWQSAKFNRNTIYTKGNSNNSGNILRVSTNSVAGTGFEGSGNTYYDERTLSTSGSFGLTFDTQSTSNALGGGILRFSETPTARGMGFKEWWASKGIAFDQNSTYILGKPSGSQVFIRPNAYEAGRANIAAYNWGLAASLPVTLTTANTGLSNGQSFKIVNAANYFGTPVYTGTMSGTSMNVSLPMNNSAVTLPIGMEFITDATWRAGLNTCPEFCAFVVLPTFSGGTLPPPPPPPPPSTKFVIGDRVQATANLNVHATPTTAGTLLGTQASGAQGTVTGGPTAQGGFNWWQIDYDTAPDGWSVEDFLVKVAALPAPAISSFTATPSSITSGQSSNLLWTTSNATTLTLTPGNINVIGSTSYFVSPSSTTAYTLTATNSTGFATASTTVTVALPPPPPPPPPPPAPGSPTINFLTVSPSTAIAPGESATLSWSVTGATTLSIDQGIGVVTSTPSGTGSRYVSPTQTTTYILTATNSAGTVTAPATVTVSQPSPPPPPPPSTGGGGGSGGGGGYVPPPPSGGGGGGGGSGGGGGYVPPPPSGGGGGGGGGYTAPVPQSGSSGPAIVPSPLLLPPASLVSFTFTRTLKVGQRGEDVRQLQIFLNAQGFTVAAQGAGSRGQETTYFGPGTARALKKFQETHAKDILAPVGLTQGTGLFGPSTRAKVYSLMKASSPSSLLSPVAPSQDASQRLEALRAQLDALLKQLNTLQRR
jgi:hypothetical protein